MPKRAKKSKEVEAATQEPPFALEVELRGWGLGAAWAYELWRGPNVEVMGSWPEQIYEAVVTDPPYGLSKEPDIAEVLRHWLEGDDYEHRGAGFMGSSWDSFVPGPSTWREVFRLLKPGGHLVCFAGTRTVDLMTIAIRMAGFEIRDGIDWIYGSGFPKNKDASKGIDEELGKLEERPVVGRGRAGAKETRGIGGDFRLNGSFDVSVPATDEAARFEGWGSQLKPAHEPIIIARRPLEAGASIARNILKHGTGAINIDGCRVGVLGERPHRSSTPIERDANLEFGTMSNRAMADGSTAQGRWPANVILSHDPSCEKIGDTLMMGTAPQERPVKATNGAVYDLYDTSKTRVYGHGAADGLEAVEEWRCAPGCPVRLMDEQSGTTTSRGGNSTNINGWVSSQGRPNGIDPGFGDRGGASRYFTQANLEDDDYLFDPFLYAAKASKSEREAGLEDEGLDLRQNAMLEHRMDKHGGKITDAQERFVVGKPRRNNHPTVKPISLMRWLVRLVTPPGGRVLDPFAGSGTTLVAAALEGLGATGIDLDRNNEGGRAGYIEIQAGRLRHFLAKSIRGLEARAAQEARPLLEWGQVNPTPYDPEQERAARLERIELGLDLAGPQDDPITGMVIRTNGRVRYVEAGGWQPSLFDDLEGAGDPEQTEGAV